MLDLDMVPRVSVHFSLSLVIIQLPFKIRVWTACSQAELQSKMDACPVVMPAHPPYPNKAENASKL